MTHKTQTLTAADLDQFTGDVVRFRHPLNRQVIYTPGVKHVAEAGQAYWLIDAIASWIGSAEFQAAEQLDERISYMHFWTFERSWSKAGQLTARADSPDRPFIVQAIEFTDFPLPRIEIWAAYDGQFWTLYLPSEH
jgi:hypothetical protein